MTRSNHRCCGDRRVRRAAVLSATVSAPAVPPLPATVLGAAGARDHNRTARRPETIRAASRRHGH